jgi:hypothetical protein
LARKLAPPRSPAWSSPSNSSAGRPRGGIPLVTKPSRHDAIMPSIRGATMSRWEEEKAERSRRSLARLTKALPRIFPSAVLSRALGRPFVPPTPRLAIDSYWGAHLLRLIAWRVRLLAAAKRLALRAGGSATTARSGCHPHSGRRQRLIGNAPTRWVRHIVR